MGYQQFPTIYFWALMGYLQVLELLIFSWIFYLTQQLILNCYWRFEKKQNCSIAPVTWKLKILNIKMINMYRVKQRICYIEFLSIQIHQSFLIFEKQIRIRKKKEPLISYIRKVIGLVKISHIGFHHFWENLGLMFTKI